MRTDIPVKGEIIEGEAADFGMHGEGVLKEGGYTVFCDGALAGERIRCKLTSCHKDYAFADIIEVLSVSKYRVKPRCPYYGRCGGCDMQHMSYDAQLAVKRNNIANILRKNLGSDIPVNEPVPSREWEYRNKLSLPFGYNARSKRVYLGFYEKRSHTPVPMKWCPLHGEWAAALIAAVTEWANENVISVYDEKTGRGVLRHVSARMLGTISVTLTVNADGIPHESALIQKLKEAFCDFDLYCSPNKKRTNVILGERVAHVYGEEKKRDLGGFCARISPASFFQVNDEVREKLYSAVCDALRGFNGDIVELYSGTGLLTARLACGMKDANIVSVEIVLDAVNDAKRLMDELGLGGRVRTVCADAAEFCRDIASSERRRALILDPPRKGCDSAVTDAATAARFDRIVYVSCNPATLARDLKALTQGGYRIESVQPYDMFPQTCHIETLVCLKRE